MPRVHYRKAAKDYPAQGIAKGEMYYYTKLKLQRGGIVKRSKTPFKQSQLTTSPFKGSWYGIEEDWNAGDKDESAMEAAAEALRELGSETQDAYDNMPEGLQQGDTGQQLEARATGCEEKADEIDQLKDEYEALEEPEEDDFDEADYDDPDAAYQEALAEIEEDRDRLRGEVGEVLSDMPEY